MNPESFDPYVTEAFIKTLFIGGLSIAVIYGAGKSLASLGKKIGYQNIAMTMNLPPEAVKEGRRLDSDS